MTGSALKPNLTVGKMATVLWLVLVLLFGLFALVPTTGVRAEDASSAEASAYTLGAGDKIKITVFGQPDLSGEFDVDSTGNISLPLINVVPAQGKTVRELEASIAQRLSPDYVRDPNITVEVLNYRPFYIFGEVNQPGSYAYVNGMTVLNAVALAGGFTYRARTSQVSIIRANDPNRTPESAGRDTPVLPGDVIEVPERYF